MGRAGRVRSIWIACALMSCAHSIAVSAQQEVEGSVLELRRAEMARFEERWRASSGEEQDLYYDLLRRRSSDLEEAFAVALAEVESLPDETRSELRAALAEHSERVTQWIANQSAEIQLLRRELPEATPERALEIENELTATNDELDRLLASQLATLERLEGLGGEVDYSALETRLEKRAELTAARIRRTIDGIAATEALLKKASGEAETAAANYLAALREKLHGTTKTLEAVSGLLERRNIAVVPYRELLLEATGRLTVKSLDREVALTVVDRAIRAVRTRIQENWAAWTFQSLVFVLIVALAWAVARVVRRMLRRVFSSAQVRRSRLLEGFVVGAASKLIVLLGLVVALAQIGVEVGPFLAGLGVAGLVLGLALQDTLSNFFSGLMILLYGPYDVDDVVEAGGVAGTVHAMNLVSTTILTFDNKKLIVPNQKIWSDTIQNVTAQELRRVDLEFGVAYDDDVEHVERVLTELVDAHELVVNEPAPNIRLHRLDDSAVTFIVRPWVKSGDYWTVYWDLMRSVKLRFDAEGISIPFPQRDVHVVQDVESSRDRAAVASQPSGPGEEPGEDRR